MNNISAPKVLVTGANGFIGHALCADFFLKVSMLEEQYESAQAPVSRKE